MSLISLIFPFEWNFVFIPVLPSKLKAFIDAPLPYIIGIYFDQIDFPADAIVFDITKNYFVKYYDTMPKIPSKIAQYSLTKLDKYSTKFNNTEDALKCSYADTTFAEEMFKMEDSSIPWSPPDIRQSFLDFFILLFKNYKKYFPELDDMENSLKESRFDKIAFLKEHNSYDQGTFLYNFVETTIFTNFIDFKNVSTNQMNVYRFFFKYIDNKRHQQEGQFCRYFRSGEYKYIFPNRESAFIQGYFNEVLPTAE